MGHPENIFLSTPDPSFICSICYEVLKDASSFKECGHTFCNECILRCLAANRSNPTCPTCRTLVHSGSNPNYALRDIIEKLKVKCTESDTYQPPLRRLTSGRGGKAIFMMCLDVFGEAPSLACNIILQMSAYLQP